MKVIEDIRQQLENIFNIDDTKANLYLLNDNNFPGGVVVEILVSKARLSVTAATECMMQTHYQGQSLITTDNIKTVEKLKNTLIKAGLKVKMEQV